jgi:hypothetical protein
MSRNVIQKEAKRTDIFEPTCFPLGSLSLSLVRSLTTVVPRLYNAFASPTSSISRSPCTPRGGGLSDVARGESAAAGVLIDRVGAAVVVGVVSPCPGGPRVIMTEWMRIQAPEESSEIWSREKPWTSTPATNLGRVWRQSRAGLILRNLLYVVHCDQYRIACARTCSSI